MGFLDKLKGAKDTAKEKVVERSDQISQGIDKAAGFVDDKTGGKYRDKIEGATGKAKEALDKLDDGDDAAPPPPPPPPPAT